MQVTWTDYKLMDAPDDLACALRTFIRGKLSPNAVAKDAVDSSETLILTEVDETGFPMLVNIGDDLYVLKASPHCSDTEPAYLKRPVRIATTYCTGK